MRLHLCLRKQVTVMQHLQAVRKSRLMMSTQAELGVAVLAQQELVYVVVSQVLFHVHITRIVPAQMLLLLLHLYHQEMGENLLSLEVQLLQLKKMERMPQQPSPQLRSRRRPYRYPLRMRFAHQEKIKLFLFLHCSRLNWG